MMTTLSALRDALREIPGVASCKIGLEDNISPADYPLIRIVPTAITPGKPYNNREAECSLYFGKPIATSAGLESVYAGLFELEASILQVIRDIGGHYIDTLTDEDRLPMYKLMVIRCRITSANQTA